MNPPIAGSAAPSPSPSTGPLATLVPGGVGTALARPGPSSAAHDAGPFSRHLRLADADIATGAATAQLPPSGEADATVPESTPPVPGIALPMSGIETPGSWSARADAGGLPEPIGGPAGDADPVGDTDLPEGTADGIETRDPAAVPIDGATVPRTADGADPAPAARAARGGDGADGTATSLTPSRSADRPPFPSSSMPAAPSSAPLPGGAAVRTVSGGGEPSTARDAAPRPGDVGSVGGTPVTPTASRPDTGTTTSAERRGPVEPTPVGATPRARPPSSVTAFAGRSGGGDPIEVEPIAPRPLGNGTVASGAPTAAALGRSPVLVATEGPMRADASSGAPEGARPRPVRTTGAVSVEVTGGPGSGRVGGAVAEPGSFAAAPSGGRHDAPPPPPPEPSAVVGVRAAAPIAPSAVARADAPLSLRLAGGAHVGTVALDPRRIGGTGFASSPVTLEGATVGAPTDTLSASAPAPLGAAGMPTPLFASALSRVDATPGAVAPYGVPLQSGADGAAELAAGVRWTFGEGGGRARLNVTPAELGPLTIRVELDGDRLSVAIAAAQPAAREALETLVPRLREQLLSDGHAGVDVDVSGGREHARADTGPGGDERRTDEGDGRRLRAEDGRIGVDASTTVAGEVLVRMREDPRRSLIDAWA